MDYSNLNISPELRGKLQALQDYLRELGSVAVAFSGGVDSTFLLQVAHDTLGDRVVAFTAGSAFVPERDIEEAREFARSIGVRHIVRRFDTLSIGGIRRNPANRCYLCKHALFTKFKELAWLEGGYHLVDGSNLDDDGDYRPGRQALAELAVLSPLHHARLYKQDIRDLSRAMGLVTWDKPSFACLASRFVYGEELTEHGLERVNLAEEFLIGLGFKQFRVRTHGDLARIELLPDDIARILPLRREVYDRFIELGYSYITLDLKGYRTGSMNETLAR